MITTLVGTPGAPQGEVIRPPLGQYANSARYLLALLDLNRKPDGMRAALEELDPVEAATWSVDEDLGPHVATSLFGRTLNRQEVIVTHTARIGVRHSTGLPWPDLTVREQLKVDAVHRYDSPEGTAAETLVSMAVHNQLSVARALPDDMTEHGIPPISLADQLDQRRQDSPDVVPIGSEFRPLPSGVAALKLIFELQPEQ